MSNSIRRKLKRKRLSVDEALAIHRKKLMTQQHCILCGAPPGSNATGIYKISPEHSHRFGGIPGHSRLEPYSICIACRQRPDALVKVEAVLAARVDAVIKAASGTEHFCIACARQADMLHVGEAWQVYGTCQQCRDKKDNLVAIVMEKLQPEPSVISADTGNN